MLAFLAALAFAVHVSQFDPWRLIQGLPRVTEFLSGMVPKLRPGSLTSDLGEWYWGLGKWLRLLWTTVMMAVFATAAGTLIGGGLSFFAARNLGASSLTVFVVRRGLEVARTVPDLVWALLFLFAFGLGPLAGVLAILVHTAGAQGKLFAEVNENIDPGPIEGVRASGGTWADEIVVGVLPQVLPNFVSYTLWRFEINVRTATVIGFVGAGGIGMELYESISLNYFDDAGAILILVFVAVVLIDMTSEWARLRLAGFMGSHA
ncbi:MAG: phosphonate ABC transporter, permease protein PhnE [Reyranella sp.]|nr:phosphonate ABC transporter, permease protein PhnE [Reyranella sp.]